VGVLVGTDNVINPDTGRPLGFFECISADSVADAANEHDLDISLFWGKANSFVTTLGKEAARAFVLMTLDDIKTLRMFSDNSAKGFDLKFDDGTNSITIKKLIPYQVTAAIPGQMTLGQDPTGTDATVDPNTPFLVELRDFRAVLYNEFFANPIDKDYNFVAPDSASPYYTYTTLNNDGTNPFTWQLVLDDLWGKFNLPTKSPQLPDAVQPHFVPQNLRFLNNPLLDVYCSLLRRLGCDLFIDPTVDPNTGSNEAAKIVQVGVDSQNFSDSTFAWRDNLTADALKGFNSILCIPSKVRVCFHTLFSNYGSELTTTNTGDNWTNNDSFETRTILIESILANPPSTNPNSMAVVWDDLVAILDNNGFVLNGNDVGDRAMQRATIYYQMVLGQCQRTIHRIYIGVAGDVEDAFGETVNGFLPGRQVVYYAVYDKGHGIYTEIRNGPYTMRVNQNGMWEEVYGLGISHLRPPRIDRPGWPLYPEVVQILGITDEAPNPDGFLNAKVQQVDPDTKSFFAKEDALIIPLT
jgi:hypothetical protein